MYVILPKRQNHKLIQFASWQFGHLTVCVSKPIQTDTLLILRDARWTYVSAARRFYCSPWVSSSVSFLNIWREGPTSEGCEMPNQLQIMLSGNVTNLWQALRINSWQAWKKAQHSIPVILHNIHQLISSMTPLNAFSPSQWPMLHVIDLSNSWNIIWSNEL